MEAEEILNKLLDSNPELAEQIKKITKTPKKRGRPKKEDDGIFIPNNKTQKKSTIDPTKTVTKAVDIDINKIKKGENHFKDSEDEYYKERPNEKKLYKSKPIERTRKNSLVLKECQECHTKVEVPVILGYADYFRCEECLLNKAGKN